MQEESVNLLHGYVITYITPGALFLREMTHPESNKFNKFSKYKNIMR
jgi:hypothetical protein